MQLHKCSILSTRHVLKYKGTKFRTLMNVFVCFLQVSTILIHTKQGKTFQVCKQQRI